VASINFQCYVIETLKKNDIHYPFPSSYIISSTLNDYKSDQTQENIIRPLFIKKNNIQEIYEKSYNTSNIIIKKAIEKNEISHIWYTTRR
jgi:hypothetical protein